MPKVPAGGSYTPLSATMTGTFQPSAGLYSPGLPPIPPQPQPVRVIDFPAGVNLNWTPRAYEPFGFPALRAFSNVELIRLAIETRKDQMERYDWRIKKIGAKRADLNDARIVAATKFMRKPDGVTHFAPWMRKLIEDLLVLDAPAIEKRRSRGGKLLALDIVDGASIKLLVDQSGRRPLAPDPAYQQIIRGTLWTDLTTRDLIYSPRNVRSNHMYGFGPVEQVVVTINTLLQRQTSQLAYFTSGNIPAGIINAPDGWTPEQIKQFQDWFTDRLSGNTAERSKLVWVPANAKYQAFKEAPIKDEFDEWLARIVSFAFSLPPTPFIKQMNRSTSENDQARAEQEGLAPLLIWAKRLIDSVIQDELEFPDLEFSWEMPVDIDPKTQSENNERDVKAGIRTINEARDSIGLDPLSNPEAGQPMAYTANGYVPLTAYAEGQQLKVEAAQNLADTSSTADGDDTEETDK